MLPPLVLALFLSMVDADTFIVAFRAAETGKGPLRAIWTEYEVRLNGVDTPESFRPQCSVEKKRAGEAKRAIRRLFADSPIAYVRAYPDKEKYGRKLVDLYNADHVDVAGELMKRGLARSYGGGTKRSWCPN